MFDSNPSHQRCRNPRCKAWLKEPAENPRNAFCCASCEAGFYRTHCRVCEKELTKQKNHADKWLVAAKYFTDNFEAVQ